MDYSENITMLFFTETLRVGGMRRPGVTHPRITAEIDVSYISG